MAVFRGVSRGGPETNDGQKDKNGKNDEASLFLKGLSYGEVIMVLFFQALNLKESMTIATLAQLIKSSFLFCPSLRYKIRLLGRHGVGRPQGVGW
jgi:hypothetical protein